MKEIRLDTTLYAITWRDAAYSMNVSLPSDDPSITITYGVIVNRTDTFTHIASSVEFSVRRGKWIDGLVIPNGAIIDIKEIGNQDA